ncbi:hypothetical protein JD276_07950 [Leucobacter sp. CSA1]|uniref:Uncharacterized protein n=1 Tax=Leucobacter chromiisoli TaxID=2796471 RepID=A0A934Q8B4_9MICO|nr:hypothetical protein [Leucobacter chromiisoli]MBK0418966.1 hypothetical protein [Leucobacter chromiisoli]
MTPFRARAERKHALAGNGPIVDRARRALRLVAEQFGEVTATTQTTVDVRTPDGIELTLSYDPGNYIFSRVYNLAISTTLPDGSAAPSGVAVSHRDRGGARYVPAAGRATGGPARGGGAAPSGGSGALRRLNEVAGPLLDGIDLHSSTIATTGGGRTLTVTPLGGSYVWVLIPPVFKATAFPQGEPERILELIRAVRGLSAPDPSSPTQKGPAS